ncbi:hypothetical protein V6N13_029904 [Hibiscus sabdariffa]
MDESKNLWNIVLNMIYLQQVSQLLLGWNCGKALENIVMPQSAKAFSSKHDFDLQAFKFSADKELFREPRVVRADLIQNSIALPTTAPFLDQKKAIFENLRPIIDAAGASGVKILCLQYMEGNTGHPVFETGYGKIVVNICYGRHHPLNWLAFGLNGAEIVFNPLATVGELSEPLWPIEARNATIANSYFFGSINRVGTEIFPNPFTSGDGNPQNSYFGHFYGFSHFQHQMLPADHHSLVIRMDW